MTKWTGKMIPPQAGRVAVVTGATGGLGFETATALARAGAEVVLTGRDEGRGRAALEQMRRQVAEARLVWEALDVASLKSVEVFAARLAERYDAIDLLINNAGVMALPRRRATVDGFEMQLGTNYLGHFALTSGLLGMLRRGRGARVVNLSSLAHHTGWIDFHDLQSERAYGAWAAYSQSKLAMLLFAREFQRRSDAGGWGVMGVAAHPGWARTGLFSKGPLSGDGAGLGWRLFWRMTQVFSPVLGQSARAGALPTLFAATATEAKGGGYYGPRGIGELFGAPKAAWVGGAARDGGVAARLWAVSERLTGATFPAGPVGGGDEGAAGPHCLKPDAEDYKA